MAGLAGGATAVAAPHARLDPTAAGQACAAGRLLTAPLRVSDVKYMRQFVACVLRKERSQLGLRYTQSRALSRGVRAALNDFVTLPYWTNHDPKAVRGTEGLTAETLGASICQVDSGFHAESSWGDTAPPALTPRVIAIGLGEMFHPSDAPARSHRALFGVASRRDLLFEKNDPNGADFGVVVVTCP